MRYTTIVAAALASIWGCGENVGPGGEAGMAAAGAASPAPSAANSMPTPAGNMPTPAGNMPTPARAEASAMTAAKPTPAADGGPNDWRPLLEGAWELPPGAEGYRCVRLTLTEDVYIKEFQPIAPLGTHHTLLSVNETPTGPDGVSVCSVSDNGHVTLLGSGVGTNYSSGPLPDGVAFKVAKGSQLNLNLHLFNVSDQKLSGVSGTKVRTTTVDKVKDFAETILAGPISLAIPAGKSVTKGQCTLKSDTTVVAVAPHMHQLGVHLKAVVNRGDAEPMTLFDGAYNFDDQRQTAVGSLELKRNDVVRVECTYQNDTGRSVAFGESSLDEMCFIGLYRYPIAGEGLICLR